MGEVLWYLQLYFYHLKEKMYIFTYMYVCVYIYTRVYVCVYISIYIYVCTYIYVEIHVLNSYLKKEVEEKQMKQNINQKIQVKGIQIFIAYSFDFSTEWQILK